MGPVLQALRLGLLHTSSPSDSGHGNQVPLGWWGGGGHGAASCRSCPVALQGGPGQGFGHMPTAGTRLYIDLLRLFVGVPPGRNRVEISAHLDRDPAARERAGNGCNTFNCYQACTVCLCIGLLVLLRRRQSPLELAVGQREDGGAVEDGQSRATGQEERAHAVRAGCARLWKAASSAGPSRVCLIA